MVKVLILFAVPEDSAKFDEHFERKHRGLLLEVPHLEKLVVNNIQGAARGTSPYHRIVELHFADDEKMTDALNSEAGQAFARDLSEFAGNGFRILFSRTETEKI